MKSKYPKVTHKVCGLPMIYYPLKVLEDLKCKESICLTGHESKAVRDIVKGLPLKNEPKFVLQTKQLGTGHAVQTAFKTIKSKSTDDVLILSGDVPLIKKETIKKFVDEHRRNPKTVLTFITVELDNPTGYGRIIRDIDGNLISITEDKDLHPSEREIGEINSGIYIAKASFLKKYLPKINNKNAQKEYYITDLVSLALKDNLEVSTYGHYDFSEIHGINSRIDLAIAEDYLKARINEEHMTKGVTLKDPYSTFIDSTVKLGSDTIIEPNVFISGLSVIGKDCLIEAGSRIVNSKIGDGCHIKANTNIELSQLNKNVTAGPFARLRPNTVVKNNGHIGNFVEIKNSVIGEGSKANHLSYIGDSTVGKNVNIGAGVITCNYDGVNKFKTIIGDNAFIGSDSQLVAPVKIGKGAYIGSGSTITENVPAGDLSLTRTKQRNIKGYGLKKAKAKKKNS